MKERVNKIWLIIQFLAEQVLQLFGDALAIIVVLISPQSVEISAKTKETVDSSCMAKTFKVHRPNYVWYIKRIATYVWQDFKNNIWCWSFLVRVVISIIIIGITSTSALLGQSIIIVIVFLCIDLIVFVYKKVRGKK